jgi:hypothetical protein
MLLITSRIVWALAVLGVANSQTPVLLGNLTTRAHEVAGVVYLLSESVVEIKVRESPWVPSNFHAISGLQKIAWIFSRRPFVYTRDLSMTVCQQHKGFHCYIPRFRHI